MAGNVAAFSLNPSGRSHSAYQASVLLPVAPEYTTGESLIASAYRTLLTGERDSAINLEHIDQLPEAISAEAHKLIPPVPAKAFHDAWMDLIHAPGGLRSPTPRGAQSTRRLKQLTPIVPELAHVAGVVGTVRNRWQPGNLLVSTIWSGAGPINGEALVEALAGKLRVTTSDDYLAQFLENSLQIVDKLTPGRTVPRDELTPADLHELGQAYPSAWRDKPDDGQIPSERFVADLECVLRLKDRLTRRQWLALLESLLRLGMGTHQLWLCRLNSRFWQLCLRACDGELVSLETISDACWASQELDDPLLRLGENAVQMIRRCLGDFALARIGLNLLLYALDDAGATFEGKLGQATDQCPTPSHALRSFLNHVAANREGIFESLRALPPPHGPAEGTAALADGDDRFRRGRATINLTYFIRYTLGQLQPIDDLQRQYDQGYLIQRQGKRGEKLLVHPAPAMLILLVHCCCQSRSPIPASIEDFRLHLAAYGIGALADELRSGLAVHDLERLGLVVDSPDADGGRLLVDPFGVEASNRA